MQSFKPLRITFENYIFIILSLLNTSFINFQIVNGQNDIEHNISKRMDLESCLGQFDIHRNMIIRTEESIAIGGKYLQGIALETVEECRRLCCETEFCDVFVFEEKSEEYCYLFECGRPENFRCKFTKHGNFTSAVLTPIRYISPPATTTIKPPPLPPPPPHIVHPSISPSTPSKQEMELKNLKQKPDAENKKIFTTTATMLTTSVTMKATTGRPSNCGRFQFQCHSGECIGIYNACNGIPQCQDGSDEGPECSDPSNTNSGGQKINSLTSVNRISLNTPNQIDDRTMHKAVEPPSLIQSLPSSGIYQQQQIMQGSPILNRDDSMTGMMWPGRKIPSQQQIDIKTSSDIFRHKSGLQIPSNNMPPFPNQNSNQPVIYNALPNQRGMYVPADLPNIYRNGIIQPQDHIILPSINWPQSQNQIQSMVADSYNTANLNIQQQLPRQPQLQSPSAVKITQETIDQPVSEVQIMPGSLPGTDIDNNKQNLQLSNGFNNSSIAKKQNDQIEKNKETKINSDEYVDYTETFTQSPKKQKHKHKKVSKDSEKQINKKNLKEHTQTPPIAEVKVPYHEGYKMEMEFIDHDGYSERPGGAVLSLTLGVLVTAALAILIGCRMRTVGRRVRRLGKAPYGNDADFLVNGMYL